MRRLTLFLSLLGTLVLGAIGIAILFNVGLPGLGGELVIPLTAITFAVWGFAGVMVLWDARRSYQGFMITVPLMLPFVLASQLRFFALIGVWGAVLAFHAFRIYRRESNPSNVTS